jgi:hypothetical protein
MTHQKLYLDFCRIAIPKKNAPEGALKLVLSGKRKPNRSLNGAAGGSGSVRAPTSPFGAVSIHVQIPSFRHWLGGMRTSANTSFPGSDLPRRLG